MLHTFLKATAHPRSSLPKDQLNGAQEPHSQPHVQVQTEFSKKETGPNGSSQTLPLKAVFPIAYPTLRQTCPKSNLWSKTPLLILPCRNSCLREKAGGSAPARPQPSVSSQLGQPRGGRWPPTAGLVSPHGLKGCCAVSAFMKCFSNKVSIPRRVRPLIRCRTCAVCQLAAEAYLNSFLDTIVLILIFSP